MMLSAEIEAVANLEADFTSDRLSAANIHPETRLATDYLNHFNEVVMLIDMLPMMPDCAADIAGWRPRSYVEHFAASWFKERDLAIAAYSTVDPARRHAFEATVAAIDAAIAAVQTILGFVPEADEQTFATIAAIADHEVKPLLEHASGLINGGPVRAPESSDANHAQSAVDALFG